MDDFTTRRGKANAFGLRQSERNLPEPGKRPLSSMTPTIVLDEQNRVAAVAGASGGPLIISGTMQALINALLWGMPAERAVGAPRVHHQWSPDRFRLEHALFDSASTIDGKTMVEGLRARGHEVEPIDAVANVQLIKRTDNGWQAACDPRKGGRPAGY
jgi:gamma-glutamyltranspeptidase/glutathione hydrolase